MPAQQGQCGAGGEAIRMKKKYGIRRCVLALLLAALLLTGCAPGGAPEPTAAPVESPAERRSGVGFYFDTVVTVTLYGAPEGLMDEIWAECARYEALLSKTVEGSDVDRVNKAQGQPVAVDPETWEILRRAKEISAMTGGAFSVTIAPLTALWDFTGGTQRMPNEDELRAALPLVNDELLTLGDDGTVTLPAGMEIDLGGIAKGYIADMVARLVRDRVEGAVLSFGGNVYAVGHKAEGAPFNVGIRDPEGEADSSIALLSITDTSVVTSGVYERFFEKDGVTYHHILDPKTGISARSDLSSATIVCESSMTADALATACIVLGRDKALTLLEENGFDGMLIDTDRAVTVTAGLSERYGLRVAEGVAVSEAPPAAAF